MKISTEIGFVLKIDPIAALHHKSLIKYCKPLSIMKVVVGDFTRWKDPVMSSLLSLDSNEAPHDVFFFSASDAIPPRVLLLQPDQCSVSEVLRLLGIVDRNKKNYALACHDKVLDIQNSDIFKAGIDNGDNVKLVFLHERHDTCAIADVYIHGLFRIYVEVDHDSILSIDVYPFLRAADVIDSLLQHPAVDYEEGIGLMLLFGGNIIEYENNHCLSDLHVQKDSLLYLSLSHFSNR